MTTKISVMAPRIAQPWRVSPTMRPKTKHSAAGIRNIDEHLHEIGQRRRILERMRRIGIEEAAAVGAQHLDGFLRGHRAHGQCLGVRGRGSRSRHCPAASFSGDPAASSFGICRSSALERASLLVGLEILNHALAHEDMATNNDSGSRMYSVTSRHVDPEIADALRRCGAQSHESGRTPRQCRSPRRRNSAPPRPAICVR